MPLHASYFDGTKIVVDRGIYDGPVPHVLLSTVLRDKAIALTQVSDFVLKALYFLVLNL